MTQHQKNILGGVATQAAIITQVLTESVPLTEEQKAIAAKVIASGMIGGLVGQAQSSRESLSETAKITERQMNLFIEATQWDVLVEMIAGVDLQSSLASMEAKYADRNKRN